MKTKRAMTLRYPKAHVFVPLAVGSDVCRTCLCVKSNPNHLATALEQFDTEPASISGGNFLREPTPDSDLIDAGEEDWTGRDD